MSTTFEDMAQFTCCGPVKKVEVDFDRGGTPVSAYRPIGTVVERDRFGNETRIGLLGIGAAQRVYASGCP